MIDDDDDFLTGDAPATGDSGVLEKGRAHPEVLKIYETGKVTVVGFDNVDIPDEYCVSSYREQLGKLINEHKCEILAFDLTGLKLVPSGMLGLLVSMRNRGVQVELYNPSDALKETLAITKLLPMFTLRELRD